jgi:hypothetical protein
VAGWCLPAPRARELCTPEYTSSRSGAFPEPGAMTQGKVVRVTVTIRTSKALHTWLVQQAKKNHRSLNVEIEYRLTKQREAEEAAEQKK